MFGFGKKKEVQKEKKFVKTIEYKAEKDFEVGKANVRLLFEDGRSFETMVYGYIDQYVSNGSYVSCSPPQIVTAKTNASFFISQIDGSQIRTYVDDPAYGQAVAAASGKVIRAEVLKSSEYSVKFLEAYVVEKEVDQNE